MGEAQTQTMETEEQILQQAEALATQGEWREAAQVVGKTEKTVGLSPRARGALAYYHSRAGDHPKAITLFEELCQLQPAEAKWHYYLGYQFQQKEQWNQAVTAYERALQLAPKWVKAHLSLGQGYESAGEPERALETYRKGLQLYKEFSSDSRLPLVTIYGKLCHRTADILLAKSNRQGAEVGEALQCLCEGVKATPNDANSWYRLGNLLVALGRLDEALGYLSKAEALAPRTEYILHKLAQAHLKKGNAEEAIKIYGRIPAHRQVPYILRGIAQCSLAKGQHMDAARRLHQVIEKEPGKFYHYWDFAQALVALKARDQAIGALETANRLFEKEHGKSYKRAVEKAEEIRSTLPPGERISFQNSSVSVPATCFGTVTKYDQDRGFGFIKDLSDGAKVFFHISRVKERTAPEIGVRVKFVRELGEKGLQASRVWLVESHKG
ncbi:MAG TPA: tetratricopeptide repeat protein [Nitrospiraceae bacterium]|jgi:tetratricopeptide (TPR) repeat protein|nr:tetratricopeptide repeat protein [Nitrospiraceae bacterium]